MSGRRDYRPLHEAHERAASGQPEAANRRDAEQEKSTERTDREWADAVESRKTRILEEMRTSGASAADLIWKERQLASEPLADHIRAIKAEEALQKGGDTGHRNDPEPDADTRRTEAYQDGPQRPLTKEEKRAKILEAGEQFEKEQEQQNSGSRDRHGGGREQ